MKEHDDKFLINATDFIEEIKDVLSQIKGGSSYGDNSYSKDKNVIIKIFNTTDGNSYEDILARLTLIDSMYSTQMNRRYYALEEIAKMLYVIGREQKGLKDYFLKIASHPDSITDYSLFEQNYGIDKNGKEKGVAISLISKYAYFETGCNFPIYDSIACEMIPLIWKLCEWGKFHEIIKYKDSSLKVDGKATIISFINTINLMIEKLGGNISYDHLDRLLWFVGKIRRGNLSLVLTKQQYIECISIYNKLKSPSDNEIFNINNITLSDFPFLNDDLMLCKFFSLAKIIGAKNASKRINKKLITNNKIN